jgi:hypothetical protein
MHVIDWVFLAWVCTSLVTFVLSRGTSAALVFKLGVVFDAVGLYSLFRCLVPEWKDMARLSYVTAFVAIPVALAFVIERWTGRNLFSALGGVSEITDIREGRLRCQGAFGHPILAGCFWAAAWPLAAATWWTSGMGRLLAVVGSLSAVTIVALSASSTPLLAAGVVVLGGLAFLLRSYLGVGRWAILLALLGLQLVMNNPIWHLFTRVNVVGGSTGWHRYYLIDEAVKRLDEWWLVGTPSTNHWGRGLGDITNQYVLEAVQGGLVGLLLFLTLAVLGFRTVGQLWRSAWPDARKVALAWALGTSLLVQCVSFFGVAYFDQTGMLWYLVLACVASLATSPDVLPQGTRRRWSSGTYLTGESRRARAEAAFPRWRTP